MHFDTFGTSDPYHTLINIMIMTNKVQKEYISRDEDYSWDLIF